MTLLEQVHKLLGKEVPGPEDRLPVDLWFHMRELLIAMAEKIDRLEESAKND